MFGVAFHRLLLALRHLLRQLATFVCGSEVLANRCGDTESGLASGCCVHGPALCFTAGWHFSSFPSDAHVHGMSSCVSLLRPIVALSLRVLQDAAPTVAAS